MLKEDYGFDERFNIYNEIENKCNKRNGYKPIASNKINKQI